MKELQYLSPSPLRIRLLSPAKLIFLLLFSLSLVPSPAQSVRELYDYQFIAKLYERQDDVMAQRELSRFRNLYPKSEFDQEISYIEASILLRNGDAQGARNIFVNLISQTINPSIKEDVYLGAIISEYQCANYTQAEYLIQRLISEVQNPTIGALAYYYRAQMQYESAKYYSAELSFRSALQYDQYLEPARLGLLKTLLKLERREDALLILDFTRDSITYPTYVLHWLEFLLDFRDYPKFEEYVDLHARHLLESNPEVRLLVIRKHMVLKEFESARLLLSEMEESNPVVAYYKALLLVEEGDLASAENSFMALISGEDEELAILSYLERIKLVFKRNPKAAIAQLLAFINEGEDSIHKAKNLFTLGLLHYHDNNLKDALRYLNLAQKQDLPIDYLDQCTYLIPNIWLREENYDPALQGFNRYLNLFPLGKFRDQAWFYMGHIYFVRKDYQNAKATFERLLKEFPTSVSHKEAKFYLAEIEFNRANYNSSLDIYLHLLKDDEKSIRLLYRVGQALFYEQNYDSALTYINRIASRDMDYEITILKAGILFNLKKFEESYRLYLKAEKMSNEQVRKTEAQSYQALVLYQLKRFKEASALYNKLSKEPGSPDTYLYLSAKSAFLAKDYHQAIQLYDRFIDQYPESKHYLNVLNELANVYYNLSNYVQAVDAWINVIRRFAVKLPLEESDIKLLTDVFAALELGLRMTPEISQVEEIVQLLDSIRSDFMRFELQFIILKLYADRSLWKELYAQAEEIRKQYPQNQRQEVEYLMADALINLNEYSQADSILGGLVDSEKSFRVLKRWGELHMATEEFDVAYAKFREAYELNPDLNVWVNLLSLVFEHGFADFWEVWNLNQNKDELPPIHADFLRMNYLYQNGDYANADTLANELLERSADPSYHAKAFLMHTKVLYQTAQYDEFFRSVRQLKTIFPDYPDLHNEATFYMIKAYLASGMKDEARLILSSQSALFTPAQLEELERLCLDDEMEER